LLGVSLNLISSIKVFAQDAVVPATAAVVPATSEELELGRKIYVEGRLPSGESLIGTRFGSTKVTGAAAACVTCHRPSGMGQVEGDIIVPPITGNYLYATRKDKRIAVMDPRVSKFMNQAHDPYTDMALAEAINNGKNNSGREMTVAMPRYDLSAADLRLLTSYLNQLSAEWSPGVTGERIRFATVIAPDVDPAERQVIMEMVKIIAHQKNGSTDTKSSAHGRHHMTSAAEMMLGTERNWDLDIWELKGSPETWGDQLAEFYRKQPVFALVSGLSNSTWQPVDDFCNREHVPCWFPSVDLPVKNQSPYALYFSAGVLLEADVLSRHLKDGKTLPKRVIQVYRDDVIGHAASQELMRGLEGTGVKVENRSLDSNLSIADSLRKSLAKVKSGDAVMYWLQKNDLAELAKVKPLPGVKNYFSETLAKSGYESLSVKWKNSSHLVYLYELPEKRAANLNYFHVWMNLSKLPLVNEAMQSEVFFSFNYLTDTISEMLDNLYRDYLIERAETMINKREGSKAEQETRDRLYLGKGNDLVKKHGQFTAAEDVRINIPSQVKASDKSNGTTMYPNLSLGPGQRFASKGGYVLGFSGSHAEKLIDESGWIVP
jgi:cytochrome c553